MPRLVTTNRRLGVVNRHLVTDAGGAPCCCDDVPCSNDPTAFPDQLTYTVTGFSHCSYPGTTNGLSYDAVTVQGGFNGQHVLDRISLEIDPDDGVWQAIYRAPEIVATYQIIVTGPFTFGIVDMTWRPTCLVRCVEIGGEFALYYSTNFQTQYDPSSLDPPVQGVQLEQNFLPFDINATAGDGLTVGDVGFDLGPLRWADLTGLRVGVTYPYSDGWNSPGGWQPSGGGCGFARVRWTTNARYTGTGIGNEPPADTDDRVVFGLLAIPGALSAEPRTGLGGTVLSTGGTVLVEPGDTSDPQPVGAFL